MRKIYAIIASIVICIGIFMGFRQYTISKETGTFHKFILSNKLRKEMIDSNIWNEKCPIPLDRLLLLKVSYYDFDGNPKHDGKLMIMDAAAESVLKIFKNLFELKFPINKIRLINDYMGNDLASMEDNNTSAFNCRNIEGSSQLSIHSYGLAIDINPIQNPFIDSEYLKGKTAVEVKPSQGIEYLNRINIRTGMVETQLSGGKTIIDIFRNNGFTIWGGKWNFPIDLHHFQVTREQAEKLVTLDFADGKDYFNSFTSDNVISKTIDKVNNSKEVKEEN